MRMEAQFLSNASIFPRMWSYIWMGQLQLQVRSQAWFHWGHKKSVTFTECIVNRQALDPNELKNDGTWNPQRISQSINFIKNLPWNIRLLHQICSEMNWYNAATTFYSEIRLLSHGVGSKCCLNWDMKFTYFLFNYMMPTSSLVKRNAAPCVL